MFDVENQLGQSLNADSDAQNAAEKSSDDARVLELSDPVSLQILLIPKGDDHIMIRMHERGSQHMMIICDTVIAMMFLTTIFAVHMLGRVLSGAINRNNIVIVEVTIRF